MGSGEAGTGKVSKVRRAMTKRINNSTELGVSFSVKNCNEYGVDWQDCLRALLSVGIRRFRLMSYWDLHEQSDGKIDFKVLDQQISMIEKAGARVSLCIGMRQPRWPETHVPQWALNLDIATRIEKYYSYHQAVIERYKNNPTIESWQLENEFWNKNFGVNNTFSRNRLVHEFRMIRNLDPDTPIIMSLANTYGLPLFAPKPDLFGSTMYLIQYENGRYTPTKFKPWYFQLRRFLMRLIGWRSLIIHELQAEPWGPQANSQMDDAEQAKSMNPDQLKKCLDFARKSGMKYIDLWGGEWWYWRKTKSKDLALWATLKSEVLESKHFV